MDRQARRLRKLLVSLLLFALAAGFHYLLPNLFSWDRLERDWPLLFAVSFGEHILPFFLAVAGVWLITSALTD